MSQVIEERVIWTTADLDLLPDNGTRYEIIDGELFMTRSPHWGHQDVCASVISELRVWSYSTGLGRVVGAPGIIFTDADNVIPDVVWISDERLSLLLDDTGHLTGAPELIVEVLSPGVNQEKRDRELKLKLYSARGVQEYWIIDWRLQTIEIYRREQAKLTLVMTLFAKDELTSPLLPGFSCTVSRFFA